MTPTTVQEAVIDNIAQEIHDTALSKGFWVPIDPSFGDICTKLTLIHSEVSEAMEVLRQPHEGEESPNTHMTEEQGEAFLCELMDIVIRTFDLAEHLFGGQVTDMLLTKMRINAGRPLMHGKRF